ncbi:hypothetical protein H6761_04045 [Candidatus Nomurabacteria bacterium]|nr:hypothetical protein [Candidatus Nomurabacteria bacterium]
MEAFYRKVYLHSWQVIRNNWYLLFFGLFVSALGLTGDFKALSNLQGQDIVSSTLTDWINIFQTFATSQITWDKMPTLLLLIGSFLLLAVILVMAISSQGALIDAANQSHKKTNSKYLLINHLQVGVENFWSLFGLNVLNKLISFVFVVGVISPIIYLLSLTQSASMMNFIISVVVFFIILPIAVIISFVTRYGASYVIIKKQNITQAFFNAWTLFKVNWIVSLENALLLLVTTVVYTIALISILTFIATPFLIIGYLVAQVSILAFWLLIFIGTFLAIAIFISAVSLFGAYYTIVWTELFLHLTDRKKRHSKIHRLAAKHLPALTK